MGSAILDMVPLMIGSAMVPAPIIMVLFLLRKQGGSAIASSFVGGRIVARLVLGSIFGLVSSNIDTSDGKNDSRTFVTVLLLVIGIVMLVTAIRLFLKEEDPDAPPPKWMKLIDTMTARTAFGIGSGIVVIALKHWFFLIGAVGVIHEADLSRSQGIIAFVVFVLGAEALVLTPVVSYALAPARTGPVLHKMAGWMERNNRQIAVAVSLIFGVYFLWKSLAELLG